ncbi:hypothetical protein [Aequorivita marina]|uniref:hypothetical protein n=1 Tax=Aequorivita marina TaxID=3073654 RepID=UPI002875F1A5|nr:hypothetical protein [Aequorivita sp. S2608]MDS1298689.1 hypothetical protein [Aequorivita sp. S2608]
MKSISTLMGTLIILSCSSAKTNRKNECPKIYKNNFSEIRNEKYETVYKNDTILFNELRFQCVYYSVFTHKVMYDNYGKWDKEIYPSNSIRPILKWENIDLFSNGKKYTIMTNGVENRKHIYASVMVFDSKNKDLLSETSTEKKAITTLFADLIRSHDFENKKFYEVYWKAVDPEYWEALKKAKNK